MRAGGAIVVLTTALAIINKNTCLAFLSDGDISSTRFANKLPEIDPKTLQQHSEFAEFANTLADAARREILPYWRQNRSTLGHEMKVETGRSMFQSASPVTLADRAAERSMRDIITQSYPEHGIYGEEYGIHKPDADWVWVLDPIDGTKSFITGKPLFGTLIGLMYKGTPVLGIIDQCVSNERWEGMIGKVSTLNGNPIQTNAVDKLADAEMFSTCPKMFSGDYEQIKFNAMTEAVRTIHYSADCYAYGLVASGFGADLVVEADLGLYDYCAIVPIVQGAGGVITDWTDSELTMSNHERSKGRVVCSGNESLHRQALNILNAPTVSPDDVLRIPKEDELLTCIKNEIETDARSEKYAHVLLGGVMIGDVLSHLLP